LIFESDGYFYYSPNDNWHGTDTFTYSLSDGFTESTPSTVTIEVASVNDTPVVSSTFAVMPEGLSTVTFTPNVTDVDSDSLTITILSVVGGTADVVDGQIVFTADDVDPDDYWTVDYRAEDADFATETGVAFISADLEDETNTHFLNGLYDKITAKIASLEDALDAINESMDAVHGAAAALASATTPSDFMAKMSTLSEDSTGLTTILVENIREVADLAMADLAEAYTRADGDDFRVKGMNAVYLDLQSHLEAITDRIDDEVEYCNDFVKVALENNTARAPGDIEMLDFNTAFLDGDADFIDDALLPISPLLASVPELSSGEVEGATITSLAPKSATMNGIEVTEIDPKFGGSIADSVYEDMLALLTYSAPDTYDFDEEAMTQEAFGENLDELIDSSSDLRDAASSAFEIATAEGVEVDKFRLRGIRIQLEFARTTFNTLSEPAATVEARLTAADNFNDVGMSLLAADIATEIGELTIAIDTINAKIAGS
jgi:hypothetical protein